MRVVAVCGGGTRFGGSAEIPLMADYLVGDSRSGMCFSEAMIGLVPGWSGVGRALTKAGPVNAALMAMTSREVKAKELEEIGIYNLVVEVPFGFPRQQRTEDPAADRAAYARALDAHNEDAGKLLLPAGLRLAACPEAEIPRKDPRSKRTLASREEIAGEVSRRKNPGTYAGLWGRPLKEAAQALAGLGRPLAPQSVEEIERLLAGCDPSRFDEDAFVRAEMEADARVYRDPRLRAGLIATLEQRVADFR
jgi:enoyl-CoA hydratase/carnithine racemase